MKALIFVLAAWTAAAPPPPFTPEPNLRALRAATDGSLQALNSLLSTPVDQAKAPALTGLIDALGQHASAAARAARDLREDEGPPSDEMTAAVKGKGATEPIDRRWEVLSAALSARKPRWEKADARARELAPSYEDERKDDKDKDRAEKKKLFKTAVEKLGRIDWSLRQAAAQLHDLGELREDVKDAAKAGAQARSELSALAEQLALKAEGIARSGSEAKAKIALLGTEPQNEARSRAHAALAPVFDGGRAVTYPADAAKNRTQTFKDRYRDHLKAIAAFGEGEKAFLAAGADADLLLTSVEADLAKLK